jgi:hypothetical protein
MKELIQKLQMLPIEIPKGTSMINFLEEEFSNYLGLISNNERREKENPMLINWHEHDTEIVQEVSQGVISALKEFYKGKHGLAFSKLKQSIESKSAISPALKNIDKIPIGSSFYRARVIEDSRLRPMSEFFHIPFNMREKVGNQRFSIQGFPCIYVGTSVYVCWLEMGCPPLDKFQVCRIEANSDLALFDYSIRDFDQVYNDLFYPTLDFIRIWPLVAASMIRVKSKEANFKEEYIIPQLLMQYTLEDESCNGLMYSSTHAPSVYHVTGSKLQNLVLPAMIDDETEIDHTTHLSIPLAQKFKITDPISWPFLQISRGYDNRVYDQSSHVEFNKRMPQFNLLPGENNSYHHSAFGQMEEYLDRLPTYEIIK